jgi:hypothetical protein
MQIAGRNFLRQGLFYLLLDFIGEKPRHKDDLPCKINLGGSSGFFAIPDLMISTKPAAKNQGRTKDYRDRRKKDLAFEKKKKLVNLMFPR